VAGVRRQAVVCEAERRGATHELLSVQGCLVERVSGVHFLALVEQRRDCDRVVCASGGVQQRLSKLYRKGKRG